MPLRSSTVELNSTITPGSEKVKTKFAGTRGVEEYNIIKDYIYEALGGQTIRLSEGKPATVDKRGAQHIAHKAGSTNKNGNAYVHVADNNQNVIVSNNALKHGLDRRTKIKQQ